MVLETTKTTIKIRLKILSSVCDDVFYFSIFRYRGRRLSDYKHPEFPIPSDFIPPKFSRFPGMQPWDLDRNITSYAKYTNFKNIA